MAICGILLDLRRNVWWMYGDKSTVCHDHDLMSASNNFHSYIRLCQHDSAVSMWLFGVTDTAERHKQIYEYVSDYKTTHRKKNLMDLLFKYSAPNSFSTWYMLGCMGIMSPCSGSLDTNLGNKSSLSNKVKEIFLSVKKYNWNKWRQLFISSLSGRGYSWLNKNLQFFFKWPRSSLKLLSFPWPSMASTSFLFLSKLLKF